MGWGWQGGETSPWRLQLAMNANEGGGDSDAEERDAEDDTQRGHDKYGRLRDHGEDAALLAPLPPVF